MPRGNITRNARRHDKTRCRKAQCLRYWPSALYRLGEVREKFVGQFLGGAVDQALAQLSQLATDLRLDLVGQKRAAVLLRKLDHGATLGEAGHPTLAFA